MWSMWQMRVLAVSTKAARVPRAVGRLRPAVGLSIAHVLRHSRPYSKQSDAELLDNVYNNPEPTSGKSSLDTVHVFHHKEPFRCENGGSLPEFQLAYETWGTLNSERSNVILLHTGLSASSHAASNEKNPSPGWWEAFIGPGKALDSSKFFIICCNVLGSCYGSTGPSSINPATKKHYATDFPILAVKDMVDTQFLLLDHLGIDKVHGSVGSSLGGMQSLCAAAHYPQRVQRVVSISACARSHPSSIALRYVQRKALSSDPNWLEGHYYDTGRYPFTGMKTARLIGTISYRSGPEWEERFGNRKLPEQVHRQEGFARSFQPDFLIEGYLDYQGHKFTTKYDPNSLLYISKAMDMFDLGEGFASLQDGLRRIQCPALILGVQSDILFPVHQQKEVATLLRLNGHEDVTYLELSALYGHDTFLIDVRNVGGSVKGHLEFQLQHMPSLRLLNRPGGN